MVVDGSYSLRSKSYDATVFSKNEVVDWKVFVETVELVLS